MACAVSTHPVWGQKAPNASAHAVTARFARSFPLSRAEIVSGLDDYDLPATVTVFNGSVLLCGPEPITAAFTPDAAEATGRLLIEAADRARLYTVGRL